MGTTSAQDLAELTGSRIVLENYADSECEQRTVAGRNEKYLFSGLTDNHTVITRQVKPSGTHGFEDSESVTLQNHKSRTQSAFGGAKIRIEEPVDSES